MSARHSSLLVVADLPEKSPWALLCLRIVTMKVGLIEGPLAPEIEREHAIIEILLEPEPNGYGFHLFDVAPLIKHINDAHQLKNKGTEHGQ